MLSIASLVRPFLKQFLLGEGFLVRLPLERVLNPQERNHRRGKVFEQIL